MIPYKQTTILHLLGDTDCFLEGGRARIMGKLGLVSLLDATQDWALRA